MAENYLIDGIDIRQYVMEHSDDVRTAIESWWDKVPEEERDKIDVAVPGEWTSTPSDRYNSIIKVLDISDSEQRSKDYSNLTPFVIGTLANIMEDYTKSLLVKIVEGDKKE